MTFSAGGGRKSSALGLFKFSAPPLLYVALKDRNSSARPRKVPFFAEPDARDSHDYRLTAAGPGELRSTPRSEKAEAGGDAIVLS